MAAQRADPDSLWHAARRMIAVRRQQPALSRGSYEFLPIKKRGVLALLHTYGGATVLTLNNLTDSPQRIAPRLQRWKGAQIHSLLSERAFPLVADKPHALTLQPYETLWLKLVQRRQDE